jgi:hypothetical protein
MKAALAAALFVLAAVACSSGPDDPEPYSAADLAWINKLADWNEQYVTQPQRIKPVYTRLLANPRDDLQPLRDVLRPYRECAQGLDESVGGQPEHPQLRRAYALLRKACAEDRRFAVRLVGTLMPNQTEPAYEVAPTSEPLFLRADELIEDGLRVNRSLPVRGAETGESRIDPRLSEAAKDMTLQDIHVRCWSTEDWPATVKEWATYSDGDTGDSAGFVTGATEIHIDPSHCATLARFLYADWRPTGSDQVEDVADAVELVAHEIEHLFETYPGEAETECHAIQSIRQLARLLGASPPYASRLARVYWTELYPREEKEYISPQCRNGGAYDERPDTDVFP